MKVINAIHAEFLKIKYLPIFWLSATIVIVVFSIVTAAHYLDINSVANLDDNPWDKILNAGTGIISVFISTPFIILLIGATVYLEHQSNIWKLQYSIPVRRSAVFYTKLITILLTIFIVYLMVFLSLILCGYLLNVFLPEMEFAYYSPPFGKFISSIFNLMLGSLGIVGIQYFLSCRFKGFLIPVSLGVIAFVVGIIVGTTNTPLAHIYPYSYPLISEDYQMFILDKIGIVDYGLLNSIELSSIAYFVIFVLLGNIYVARRNV